MIRTTTGVWSFVQALTVLALVVSSADVANAQDTWQTGMSVYHSSGDYGTGSTTTITAVPLSIRRLFQDGDVTLIVPFLSVTSDCSVTLLSGEPNQTGGTCPQTTITTKNGKQELSRIRPTTTTESGIGDVVLRARYYVVDEHGLVPTVAVTAKIKFPTADRDRGLGTGEFDEGLGLQVSKKLTEAWISFMDLGYTNLGNPPGVTLRNQWNYDLGVGYYFTKALLASVFYEEWTAVISGLQNPRDLLVAMNYTASSTWRFNSFIARGLSDGAPDWAFTVGLNARF
ncbi:MAG TPA: transporter [Nitrospiraceae bacterium]|nr:transporter [Nitrospiraceae bacterium]